MASSVLSGEFGTDEAVSKNESCSERSPTRCRPGQDLDEVADDLGLGGVEDRGVRPPVEETIGSSVYFRNLELSPRRRPYGSLASTETSFFAMKVRSVRSRSGWNADGEA